MKRASAVFLSVSLLMTSVFIANGQRREQGNNDHRKQWQGDRDKHAEDHRREERSHYSDNRYNYEGHRHADNDNHRYHHSGSHMVVVHSSPSYTHHHSNYCDHRVMVRHYERPRYVYYRDYDVYYDYQRNAYITLSGRRWIVSTAVPRNLQRVNLREARCEEVNYYDDDFVTYLDNGRPMYGRVYTYR